MVGGGWQEVPADGADKHHLPGTRAPHLPPLFALDPAASNHPSHSLQISLTKNYASISLLLLSTRSHIRCLGWLSVRDAEMITLLDLAFTTYD